VPGRRCVAAHPAVVKAEKVKALPTFCQMHDPRLGTLQLKAKLGQDRCERNECAFGFLPGSAHGQQIIRVADQHAGAAVCPLSVEPVQVDVGQAR
jgi:hypothetical protein